MALVRRPGSHASMRPRGNAGQRRVGAIARRAEEEGVAVLPLFYHYLAPSPAQGLLLGYRAIQADRVGEALRRLARCFDTPANRSATW